MGVQIEIVERNSAIVVTLTGATDPAVLEPLQDALGVAAKEGKAVVLDITDLGENKSLDRIVTALGSAITALKVVAPNLAGPSESSEDAMVLYPNVDSAIAALRRDRHSEDIDLAAKYDDLEKRYEQMINKCRQLLETLDESIPAPAVRNPDPRPDS